MKAIVTYLTFDGTTREAMTFYQSCLGGKLDMQTFADMNVDKQHPGSADRILHAQLTIGSMRLMASDTPGGQPVTQGNYASICLDCDTPEEAEKLFSALGAGGTAVMPMMDMFWGAHFGIVKDRFGISWMLNADLPKEH